MQKKETTSTKTGRKLKMTLCNDSSREQLLWSIQINISTKIRTLLFSNTMKKSTNWININSEIPNEWNMSISSDISG